MTEAVIMFFLIQNTGDMLSVWCITWSCKKNIHSRINCH